MSFSNAFQLAALGLFLAVVGVGALWGMATVDTSPQHLPAGATLGTLQRANSVRAMPEGPSRLAPLRWQTAADSTVSPSAANAASVSTYPPSIP